ncbi:MAG TPA: class I adenylate-forming enzyme family protein [Acidimicrobiales bacterium]|jgi:acyl-CoA synthetase (AMP-forming)/AMP-acid ligase II|nr:class I adenylate-forming enzyme family protein [Acidimicrobiales bacterium]
MPKSVAEIRAELTAPGQLCEVDEVDIGGMPMRVWKNAPPTLRAVLDLSAMHGDKPFIVYEDERLSFAEHYRRAATFAHRLIDDYGVRKGDRVAIAMRNFPEWLLAFWGATVTGAIVVPLNAWWTGPELEYGIEDSGAKVLIVDEERAQRLRPYSDMGLSKVIVGRAQHPLTDAEVAFEDVLGSVSSDVSPPDVPLEPEDDATIFYTSGTTGFPKGALGTHRNICTNVLSLAFGAIYASARKAALTGDAGGPDVEALASGAAEQAVLLSVPLFHVTGCHAIMLGSISFGGKLVIMYKWDPERALELIERERITTIGGVPAMVWQLLESPSFDKTDISSVSSIGYGGAPAPPELVRRIEELFPGRTPTNGWGMTETSSTAASNNGIDYIQRPDSCGPPLPVNDVRVVGEDLHDLPQGEAGELWVRGPNVVKGYWNKPEATAETFVEGGWLRTGDIARIDEDGFITITDRAKDMIIRGGENIYSAEVEGALFEHPAVTDVAVFGIPHDVLGEEVGAVVLLRSGTTATVDELQTHARDRLAAFKVPVRIWFWDDELPRNPAGKILKRDLRDAALSRDS